MSSNKTLANIVKDKLTNMPENFDDKEIVNYVKDSIKEAKVELKSKKSSKNKNVNSDVEKPKYTLSAYQEFMKEHQVIFKEKYPELSSKERLGKIAEEWNKTKNIKVGNDYTDTPNVKDEVDEKENKEVKKDEVVETDETDEVVEKVDKVDKVDAVVKKKVSKKK
jgi:hypothetical protein